MRKYRYGLVIALAAITALSLAAPVLAAYYSQITVTESNGTSYDMLPVIASVDIDYLADNQFIESDGRDVRVRTVGGAEVPFMLTTEKVLFAAEIEPDLANGFRFTTGNSLIDDYSIVTGDGGYVTIADNANLEPAADFEIEFDGYIDTSDTLTLVEKPDYFDIATDGGGNIISTIYCRDDIIQTGAGTAHQLYSGSLTKAGQRVDSVPSGYITQISFSLMKVGSPTGTAYIRVRSVSGDSVIGTIGTLDVSTITTDYVWYDFTGSVLNPTQQDLRFTCEYDGGDVSNLIRVAYQSSDTVDGDDTYYSGSWTDNTGKDCSIKIYFIDTEVTAAATAGEHTIKLIGDGVDFKIYVDSVEKDTAAVVEIADSANDWTLADLPYMNYFKLTTSDTLRLTYDPDDIISGTTLINETDAGTYDGTITYGSNPAGISVNVSGLETYAASYPTDPAESQDIISPTTAPLFDVDLDKLEYNPLQPIVAVIADTANLTERLVWLAGGFIFLFIILVLVLWKSEGQISFTAFAGLGYCVICYMLGIFPLWVIIVFAIGAVASIVYERVIAL